MADETQRLLALADAAEVWWLAAVTDPLRAELATLRDDEIVGQLTPYLTGDAHHIIDAATWTQLLLAADHQTKGGPKLSAQMAAFFAEKLAGSFAHDFVEALKTDLETGGKAYAAVSLRFFAEILGGVNDNKVTLAELAPVLRRLPELLKQVETAAESIRRSGSLAPEVVRSIDATDRALGHISQGIDKLVKAAAETKSTLGDIEAGVELLVEAFALARAPAVPAFRADISRIVKYAPAELIGRELETKILADAWDKAVGEEKGRPHVLTFVALGGEGKTSLVAKWAADLAAQDWPGCEAVFAWSFYSQGTREQTAVSSDLFLAEALTFFGDAAMAGSAQGAFEKGKRLAQLVGARRALLILDGLEPLQYAPTSPTPGELKDQGLGALLKGLAATSHGLCVVTTRYALPDLRAFHGRTVREEKLARLARSAGVQLLKAHGVTGSDRRNLPLHDGDAKSELVSEFEKLVEDVDGHALTLHIMGSFLKKAFGGDIRKRDRVTFAKASQKTDNGHAFRAMETYARWMEDGSDEARRELAILRLMGLFDRPATADCLAALLAAPAIPGLTEPLTGLPEEDWNCSLESLVAAKLLTVSPETVSVPASAFPLPASLDAHPLIREYFAVRVRSSGFSRSGTPGPAKAGITGEEWREAHRRLYEHLCATTKEGDQPTLEALQPLYQAVAHGCQAGLQQEAHDDVHLRRIRRGGQENYSTKNLGAFGSDLGALACFFERPWSEPSPRLRERDQAILLGNVAFRLRAVGRLNESLEPMRAGLEMCVKQENWKTAAISYSNLSELELTLGEVAGAVGDAEQSVTYAGRSGDAFWKMGTRTTHADALHQAGVSFRNGVKEDRRAEAEARFREAEQMQAERQPAYPLLYSLGGFQYCDLLLAEAERAAWQTTLECGDSSPLFRAGDLSPAAGAARQVAPSESGDKSPQSKALRAVSERAAKTIKIAESEHWLLDIALDHLTLGRAALYAAILEGRANRPGEPLRKAGEPQLGEDASPYLQTALRELDAAVSGLRRAGTTHWIPGGLLTRAWQRSLTGALTSAHAGPDSAQSDLDEAEEIAARGPMPLFLADVYLYRARLFFREAVYPFKNADGTARSARQDLADARRLITKETVFTQADGTTLRHSYGRRLPELEDAEKAILK